MAHTCAISPWVVEVLVDVAINHGVLRHLARYLRPRPDVDVAGLASSG